METVAALPADRAATVFPAPEITGLISPDPIAGEVAVNGRVMGKAIRVGPIIQTATTAGDIGTQTRTVVTKAVTGIPVGSTAPALQVDTLGETITGDLPAGVITEWVSVETQAVEKAGGIVIPVDRARDKVVETAHPWTTTSGTDRFLQNWL